LTYKNCNGHTVQTIPGFWRAGWSPTYVNNTAWTIPDQTAVTWYFSSTPVDSPDWPINFDAFNARW
jgi:hypothetical protein